MRTHLRIRSAMVLALVLLGGRTGEAPAQPSPSPPPRQGGPITVTSSPGATTTVTTNVVYQEARRDPRTQEFVAALQGFTQLMSARPPQAQPVAPPYLFAIDDPRANETNSSYFIIVGDLDEEQLGDSVAQCEVGPGVDAFGQVFRVPRDASRTRIMARLMTRDEAPILERVCRGLRQPLSSLSEGQANAGRRGRTVFDYLSRYTGGIAIMLMPARISGEGPEERVVRDFWKDALAFRYYRLSGLDVMATPDGFDQVDGLSEGEWMEVPLALPPGFVTARSYPPQAREDFGNRIERLETDWADYLTRAAVTLRNVRRPLLANGRPSPIVPRFTLDQVGSREFWLAANDLRSFLEQSVCLGQHFLTDHAYVSPAEVPYTGQCPLGEIRLPAG